jgi:hypothetical protein
MHRLESERQHTRAAGHTRQGDNTATVRFEARLRTASGTGSGAGCRGLAGWEKHPEAGGTTAATTNLCNHSNRAKGRNSARKHRQYDGTLRRTGLKKERKKKRKRKRKHK